MTTTTLTCSSSEASESSLRKSLIRSCDRAFLFEGLLRVSTLTASTGVEASTRLSELMLSDADGRLIGVNERELLAILLDEDDDDQATAALVGNGK